MRNIILSLISILLSIAVFSQEKAYTNAIIHTGNGEVLENAYMVVNNGRITELSTGEYNGSAEKVNLEQQHVYPGIIAPNSTLGLQEIGSVRATRDQREIGWLTPNVRSQIAFNTDSKILPTATCNGVLTAQVTPRGGFISGQSSIMKLDERNWEEATLKANDGMHFYLPRRLKRSGWWANPGPIEVDDKYQENLDKIEAFLTEAQAYHLASNPTFNANLQGMKGVFAGDQKIYAHSNSAQAFLDFLEMTKAFKLSQNIVWVGAYEADLIMDELKENRVSVLLRRTHDLPMYDDDDLEKPYRLAATLMKAGILVGLENTGDMEQMNSRNFPYYAAQVTQYGISDEEALKLITINTAQIIGIDKELGSLEEGKIATFFVSKGNMLEIFESDITHAFIEGRKIDFSKNHQLQLYHKYKDAFD